MMTNWKRRRGKGQKRKWTTIVIRWKRKRMRRRRKKWLVVSWKRRNEIGGGGGEV